ESCINVSRHLVACRGEVRILSVLAASKAPKVQRERVIAGGTQHGSESVVNLSICVALVEQENSRTDLSGRVHGSFQGEPIRRLNRDLFLFGIYARRTQDENDCRDAKFLHLSLLPAEITARI